MGLHAMTLLLLLSAMASPGESSEVDCFGEDCFDHSLQDFEDSGLQLLQLKARANSSSSDDPMRFPFLRTWQLLTTVSPYPCWYKPEYCGRPLHCDRPGMLRVLGPMQPIATNGHANLQTWCLSDNFRAGIVDQCLVKHDLSKAGRLTYAEQARNNALESDGSYCFAMGHCLETRVTDATTMAEAEQLCDEKYGHKAWASLTISQLLTGFSSAIARGQISSTFAFKTRESARPWAELACAMGNLHCDVVYCRENYCNKEHFRSRYLHLQPS